MWSGRKMANYKNKKVTNLLEKICKALDILESKDISLIKQNYYLFNDIQDNVIRQCKKYIKFENHELDFTHEDLKNLSDEMFNVINRCQKMQYKQLEKRLMQKLPIEMEDYNKLCFAVGDSLYFDQYLRPIANDLSFWAITTWLWSESDYKKPFEKQLLDHIRSFI